MKKVLLVNHDAAYVIYVYLKNYVLTSMFISV